MKKSEKIRIGMLTAMSTGVLTGSLLALNAMNGTRQNTGMSNMSYLLGCGAIGLGAFSGMQYVLYEGNNLWNSMERNGFFDDDIDVVG